MKSNSKGDGDIHWSTTEKPAFIRGKFVTFPAIHDNDWHEYTVKLDLADPLHHLRIDPSTAPGEMRIEYVRLKGPGGEVIKEWRFDR